MKTLTPIQLEQANLLMQYFIHFEHWPQSLPDMLEKWTIGFDRKTRKKDLVACLNYLAESGKIVFETHQEPYKFKEIAFRLNEKIAQSKTAL
jgi:hypothetical protein